MAQYASAIVTCVHKFVSLFIEKGKREVLLILFNRMKKTILFYYLGVLCDLSSTYLVTPDLATERNPLILFFHLSWVGIIVGALAFVTLVSWGGYRLAPYLADESATPFYRRLAYLVVLSLHFHLLFSYFAALNNLTGYAFLYADKQSVLWAVAERYTFFAYNYTAFFYGMIALGVFFIAFLLVNQQVKVTLSRIRR
jgi:hypothetical protein